MCIRDSALALAALRPRPFLIRLVGVGKDLFPAAWRGLRGGRQPPPGQAAGVLQGLLQAVHQDAVGGKGAGPRDQ
eukprot:14824589-Alexandrium_andersonii.AAC.1